MRMLTIGSEAYENMTLTAMMANRIGPYRFYVTTGAEEDEKGKWFPYTTIICRGKSTALSPENWDRIVSAKTPEQILDIAHEMVREVEG